MRTKQQGGIFTRNLVPRASVLRTSDEHTTWLAQSLSPNTVRIKGGTSDPVELSRGISGAEIRHFLCLTQIR